MSSEEYKIINGPGREALMKATFNPLGNVQFTFVRDGKKVSTFIISSAKCADETSAKEKWQLIARTADYGITDGLAREAVVAIAYNLKNRKGVMALLGVEA